MTAITKLIHHEFESEKVLVVAPKRVVESVWQQEANKWSHLKDIRVVKVSGDPKKRKKLLKQEADIYLISRDLVTWLCTLYGGNRLPFDALVIDESSSFKSHSSKRFKALRKISFDRVVLLTGTPAPNSIADLWSQIYLLDRGERLGRTVTEFRLKYFNEKPGYGGNAKYSTYDPKKGAFQAVQEKIADLCLSMKAEDFLDLPDRIDNLINIDFDQKTQKAYNQFAKEQIMLMLTEIGGVAQITAATAAALSTKLLQFANGAIYDEDRNVHEVHNLKLQALEEIVEAKQGGPVLVAYNFQHDRDRIMRHLKKYNPVQMKTDQHVQDWNSGKIQVMLMHPASGGHGLNLQKGGDTIVWFGLNWSLELYQQFNARIHRQGVEWPVYVHHLVCNKTIDGRVVRALQGKADVQEALMQAIKATAAEVAKLNQ